MTSTVLVQIPSEKFNSELVKNVSATKTGKSPEIADKCEKNRYFEPAMTALDPSQRISQLEQNIRFLKTQHLIMLTSLHEEIELLRERNKDLQFQLVFNKGGNTPCQDNSPSSQEDDLNKSDSQVKDANLNLTKLMAEDMAALKEKLDKMEISLDETNVKNAQLSAIIEDQKQQIEILSQKSQNLSKEELTKDVQHPTEEELKNDLEIYVGQLQDAEHLIQCLKKENEMQKAEIERLKTNSEKSNYVRRNNQGFNQQKQKFPPLMQKTFWQSRSKQNNGDCSSPRVNSSWSRNRSDSRDSQESIRYHAPVSLPHVRNYNGQNNYYPNGSHHYYTSNNRGHQRNDDYDRNPNIQGYRKYQNGSRGMSQEPN